MLLPNKVKHRKWHRGRPKKKTQANRGTELAFGAYGLKTMEPAHITSRQIEAARRAMTRYIQKKGKIWIRIFPDKPVTNKGAEVPMGGGKGSVDHYACPVAPGRILFEMDGIPEELAREAMRLADFKLPVKTKFITR